MTTLTTLGAAATLAGLLLSGDAPPRYTVTVLQSPPSFAGESAQAINAAGRTAGSGFNLTTGYFDGLAWDRDGVPMVLSAAYGLDIAEGLGIHDDGVILAAAVEDANAEVQHGAVLAPDGTYQLLPSLAGSTGVVSAAFDKNDAGTIAGRSARIATPHWLSVPNDAVIWVGGQITSIGTLGGFFATARRINNNGVIIGESNTATSDFARGFVWDSVAGMQEIPPLAPSEFGHVSDLNEYDVIVGRATLGASSFAAVWRDYTMPPALLDALPGDGNSSAGGINDRGDIVGGAQTPQGSRARLWVDGKAHDLNDLLAEPLGFPLVGATRITDNGLILARGQDPNVGFVDVVLAPLAEQPGTAYCFCDGSGAPPPCGNPGSADGGCANSSGAGGVLAASGSSSVGANDLAFQATQLLPGHPALLFAGEHAVNGGNGARFGDGLRCAGVGVQRLGVAFPDASGTASFGPGLGQPSSFVVGATHRFQAWYRDPVASPCGHGFNLTNGYEVLFTP